MPAVFDAPLAAHHKLIGRWAAAREASAALFTRVEARRHIERAFDQAVLDVLKPVQLADFRVVVLLGDDARPPALAIICNTVGQLDLGWIERGNPLALPAGAFVPSVRWCATAYRVFEQTLGNVLPIFSYQDLFDEVSMSYWDGETDDAAASRALVEYHGADLEELDGEMLPSAMNGRRPDWMLEENAAPLKDLPRGLADAIRKLRASHKAFMRDGSTRAAWCFGFDELVEYVPDYADCATLPPMTLVPADHFYRELDDVGRHGMEYGFMDVAGLCQLSSPDRVDEWFASVKLGVDVLVAAQELTLLDPAKLRG